MTDHTSNQTITPQHARTIASITAARNMLTRSLTDLTARGQEIPDQARTILEYLDTAAVNFAQLCEPHAPQASIAVHLTPNEKNNPPGKLADAEIHFLTGPLAGSKLIGFAIWERRTGGGRNVTFPARQYSINGERRSFALLRPAGVMPGNQDGTQERIREIILRAYASYDSPGMHTRSTFDDAGQLLTMDGGINLTTPADPNYSGPKDLCPEHQGQDEPARETSGTLEAAGYTVQDAQVNPGILLGTMIVEAVYGPPAQPSPLESSPDAAEAWSIDARMAEAAAQRQTSAAPKVRRF